jgi:dihydropteroate synthase
MAVASWKIAGRTLPLGARSYIMGVLNVTPDSFSDGGEFFDTDVALTHALRMVAEGAEIIDIGGESTRPGAEEVSETEELRRVLPVISRLAGRSDVVISIDTSKAAVADAAVQGGAKDHQ